MASLLEMLNIVCDAAVKSLIRVKTSALTALTAAVTISLRHTHTHIHRHTDTHRHAVTDKP